MANRDKSTEKVEVAAVEVAAPVVPFPTSADVARAKHAAGSIRVLQPDSIDKLIEVVEDLKARRG